MCSLALRFTQVRRAKEEAREEVLEVRLKLKEVEASVEIRKESLEEAEGDWRRKLGEQLDVVDQLQQANSILQNTNTSSYEEKV